METKNQLVFHVNIDVKSEMTVNSIRIKIIEK